ncbi:MAG TPA: family 78 glycoside hydrolase catalytic domain, partial [Eudoraea sp.]|nr:family 78 glycoside hydrolase catalytic domain [Eudoraea sp.]
MKRNYSTIRVGKWMFAILAFSFFNVLGQSGVTGLKVEYREAPLGIDMDAPRFSWQMATNPMKRGQFQTAYQVIVSDEAEAVVWDSQKQESDSSSGVKYGGGVLTPGTKYNWQVKVWDETGSVTTASSWFETGLMDPDPRSDAWHGAQWIGGGDEELVLYSHYLSVFKMVYSLQLDEPSESTAASFVFGANDRRLMDKDKNIQGVGVQKDESYIRFELDITKVNGKEDGLAKFNVYRVGYTPDDSNAEPVRSYDIPSSLLNETNKYEKHTFHVSAVFGLFEVFLDGTSGEHKISDNDDDSPPPRGKIGFNLNPVGKGNDYISFPMIADIGFYAGAHQKAQFSEVQIRNYRAPSNVLFKEDMPVDTSYSGIYQSFNIEHPEFTVTKGGYQIGGGARGSFVVADPSRNAAPMLRTTFNTSEKKIKKARVYATARGIYELYLNGERVGDDYFNPGLTQYNKTQIYQTYDVTDQLKEHGKNALGAWLSEGWWSGNITYSGENWNYFGDRQSLLAQLVITYDDDSEQVITTNDTAWKLYTDGPIRYGSFFQGEVYDATREKAIDDWALPDYKDSGWKSPLVVSLEETAYLSDEFQYYDLKLIGQIGENPTIVRELVPQAVEEVRPGVFVYDMGQNMVGFPKVTLPAGMAGDTVTFRYAEVKYPDLSEYKQNTGMVMLENIRAALTQDLYFRNGGGSAETFQPRFTFHGYRFLEISGIEQPLPLENVKGMVVSSIRELASDYKTSNELVNKLWENITWSLRSNFLSIPTDTPARNERMGWSGDINVFSAASTYLADVGPFLSQHLLAMRDIQRKDGRFTDVAPVGGGFGGTLWGSAGIIVAWQVYQQYGDLALLQVHYDAMKKYVEFLNSRIDPETGVLNEGPLGDWLSPEGYKNDDTMLWAAYHLHDLEILA